MTTRNRLALVVVISALAAVPSTMASGQGRGHGKGHGEKKAERARDKAEDRGGERAERRVVGTRGEDAVVMIVTTTNMEIAGTIAIMIANYTNGIAGMKVICRRVWLSGMSYHRDCRNNSASAERFRQDCRSG